MASLFSSGITIKEDMKREEGSFKEGVLPLSLALICVCGNKQEDNGYINCNEDGIPFSIWEAWAEGNFPRPQGFTEPPETPYGFCVLCPVCGRFYSEKEMEITDSAVVSGMIDPEAMDLSKMAKDWYAHNEEFFRKNVDKATAGKHPAINKRPRSKAPRPADAPNWNDPGAPEDPWNPYRV